MKARVNEQDALELVPENETEAALIRLWLDKWGDSIVASIVDAVDVEPKSPIYFDPFYPGPTWYEAAPFETTPLSPTITCGGSAK